ncbi:hypothetical protein ONZ45_g101 [Pleurotus djamor]|nr:hypothetical protein ONZ45_g101 [Pleurotus djamor]
MSSARLPAVRLSSVVSDGENPSPLLPQSSKFGFTWTNEADGLLATVPSGQSDGEAEDWNMAIDDPTPSLTDEVNLETKGSMASMFQPRISRALSMPLPSQLGHLQNPHRSGSRSSDGSEDAESSQTLSRFHDLSLELADSVQMVIQTMLQISPPQILDPAKEQFSACALAVPTPSMSAMFTTLKGLNYISANMISFCDPSTPDSEKTRTDILGPSNNPCNDFDIGELLQSVGDALSGSAAQAGVDLVIYHADVGMKHVMVRGDEAGLSFMLSHIVRRILSTAKQGDSIELGLYINPTHSPDIRMDESQDPAKSTELGQPLHCVIDIGHKYAIESTDQVDSNEASSPHRDIPSLKSTLLRRLLLRLDASLETHLPPKSFSHGRVSQLELTLARGISPASTPSCLPLGTGDEPSAREPTIEELATFAETLRGKKGTLYASSKGSFAHHFASYLATWGMDVNHVSADTNDDDESHGAEDALQKDIPSGASSPQEPTYGPHLEGYGPNGPIDSSPPSLSFVFIDDDVSVLKTQLQTLRTEQRFNLTLKKRPPLGPHHRRSSPQLSRNVDSPSSKPPAVAIVHFTSLSNFKVIKDMIQSMVSSYAGSMSALPEVMIIPKPAGPRRFLTALYTAITKPFVDPFFVPIATSPITPSIPLNNPFFPDVPPASSPIGRPSGFRTHSGASNRSAKDSIDHAHPAPSSPLARPDNVEYFSQAADQFGSSPAAGVVIQSPDGQPHGIFFAPPRGKTPRQASGPVMERDKGQLGMRLQASSQLGFSSFQEMSIPTSNGSPGSNTSTPRFSNKKPTSPRLEESVPVTNGIASVRKPSTSDVATRKSPPPGSPVNEQTPVSPRRALRRKSTQEPKQPITNSRRKKGKTTDNIVPPVKVLIVEDNPINQTILSTFMKRKKITYEVAKNGLEAVEKWRTGGFHLILMDIQMPVMDGLSATKEIRRLEKSSAMAGFPPTPLAEDGSLTLRTPSETSSEVRNSPYRSSVIIVALTASSSQSDRVTALAAGCNDFLTKPVSLEWLENKIIEWGSIKALQMWADLRPEALRTISSGQSAQARNVADRLHVPKERTAASSPSRLAVSTQDIEASNGKFDYSPSTSKEEDKAQAFAANVAGLMRSPSTSSSLAAQRRDTLTSLTEVSVDHLANPLLNVEQESPIDMHTQSQAPAPPHVSPGAPVDSPKESELKTKLPPKSELKSTKPPEEANGQVPNSAHP